MERHLQLLVSDGSTSALPNKGTFRFSLWHNYCHDVKILATFYDSLAYRLIKIAESQLHHSASYTNQSFSEAWLEPPAKSRTSS